MDAGRRTAAARPQKKQPIERKVGAGTLERAACGHYRALSSSHVQHRPEPDGSGPPLVESRRATRDRWLLLGLLLLALGAGVGLGIAMSSRFEPARAVAAPPAEVTMACQCPDAVARLCTAPLELEPTHALAAAPLAPALELRRRAARVPGAATSARRAKTGALGPDLHEGLQLLRTAQQALRAADTARALSTLGEMDRRVPDLLVEEREVTRALAHCAAHDVASARRTAAGLRESGAASVYEHRLSESCVGPGPTPASLLEEMRRRALN